jgi:hypothetical protein
MLAFRSCFQNMIDRSLYINNQNILIRINKVTIIPEDLFIFTMNLKACPGLCATGFNKKADLKINQLFSFKKSSRMGLKQSISLTWVLIVLIL